MPATTKVFEPTNIYQTIADQTKELAAIRSQPQDHTKGAEGIVMKDLEWYELNDCYIVAVTASRNGVEARSNKIIMKIDRDYSKQPIMAAVTCAQKDATKRLKAKVRSRRKKI